MTVGHDKIKESIEQNRVLNQRKRPPEVWLKDGEERVLRFVNSSPICSFAQYSIKVNGKWMKITAPGIDPATGRAAVDLIARAGFTASPRILYEVIDRSGYTTKDGTKVKDVPRFYVVSQRVFEQIEQIRKKYHDLTKMDIDVVRTGQGTQTTYSHMPNLPSPFNFGKVESIAHEVADYYAPMSTEEQRSLLASMGKDVDHD